MGRRDDEDSNLRERQAPQRRRGERGPRSHRQGRAPEPPGHRAQDGPHRPGGRVARAPGPVSAPARPGPPPASAAVTRRGR